MARGRARPRTQVIVVGTDSSQQDGTNRGVGARLSNDGQARRNVGVGVVGCNDSVDQGERNIVLAVVGRGRQGGWKEGAGVVATNGNCGQVGQITGSSAVKVGRGNGYCVEKRAVKRDASGAAVDDSRCRRVAYVHDDKILAVGEAHPKVKLLHGHAI